MKHIVLGNQRTTVVDDKDYARFANRYWQDMGGYVGIITYKRGGKRNNLKLHRLILNASGAQEVDHINGNTYDNRRANLRLVSRLQNGKNRKINSNNSSRFKNVSKHRGKWCAYIKVNGVQLHLGLFRYKEEAALVSNWAADELFQEFKRGIDYGKT